MSMGTGAFFSDSVKVRANYNEKVKKDFERQREIIDHLDVFYGHYRDEKKINKFKINFELLNGYLDVKLYEDPLCFDIGKEEVNFDFQNISHTPIISQYAQAILGEERNKPFKPTIKDLSPTKNTFLKRRAQKVNKQFMIENIVNPMRTQIMNDIMRKSGQDDIFAFANSPEKQLELEQQINFQLEQELPRDIVEFINGNVQSVTAKQAQRMLNHLVDVHNIRFKQTKGFKNAVVTGEEYYYAGEYAGGLFFSDVNPMYLSWGGGDRENEWCQKGDWVKRERWLSYQQLISNHSDKISPRDLELIDLEVEPVGGYSKGLEFWDRDHSHTKKLMWTYSSDEGFRNAFSDINIKTKEGRQKLFQMYDVAFSRFGDEHGTNYSDYGIREAHFQWRDLRPMMVVEREVNGKMKKFWLPEHYEPTHLDYNVQEVWVNQVWEGWKIGTYDGAYLGIREVPYQYKSMHNPNDVDLNYYGKKYNTHDNSVRNVALIDIPKAAQKSFDMILASIRQDMATNTGKVFTMFMNMKPEGWTYQEWLDLARNGKILMLDPSRANQGLDYQFLKNVDMGTMADIANKIQLLEFYRQQIALSMYFNDERAGVASPYASAENVQQNSIAVHNKTSFFIEQHRQVVESALTGFLNRARHYYKEHPEQAAVFLDDTSLIDLQNAPLSWYEWLGVKVQNSEEEQQKLDVLKTNMLGFIQNGSSPEAVMSLIFAESRTEIMDIVTTETKRLEKIRQEELQAAEKMNQDRIKASLEEKEMEVQLELQKQANLLQSQEKRTLWDREKFKMQNDVDDNKVNDLLQKTFMEIESKLQMQSEDLTFEREKLELTEKLEMAKLDNERSKIKKLSTR